MWIHVKHLEWYILFDAAAKHVSVLLAGRWKGQCKVQSWVGHSFRFSSFGASALGESFEDFRIKIILHYDDAIEKGFTNSSLPTNRNSPKVLRNYIHSRNGRTINHSSRHTIYLSSIRIQIPSRSISVMCGESNECSIYKFTNKSNFLTLGLARVRLGAGIRGTEYHTTSSVSSSQPTRIDGRWRTVGPVTF